MKTIFNKKYFTKHRAIEYAIIASLFFIDQLLYQFFVDVNGFNFTKIIIGGIIYADLLILFDIFVVEKYFKRIPYSISLILTIIIFILAYTISKLAINIYYSDLPYFTSFMEFNINLNTVIVPNGVIQHLVSATYLAFMISVIIQIKNMMGPGVLLNYMLGKYHKPRSEERIFMFLDLKSSVTIAEKLGHSLYSEFLKEFFYEIDNIIIEMEGRLYQYVGDEIVIIWDKKNGIKKNNCINTYYRIEEKINQLKEHFIQRFGVYPEYKAGLHCGEVSITEIGVTKKEIAYHGDPINTTARICSLCNELNEKFLISEELLKLLSTASSKLETKFLGGYKLKGKKEKVNLYGISLTNNITEALTNIN